MYKTTFAVIGTGIVGERIINQILSHPTCEIIGLYDENKSRLSEIEETYRLHTTSTLDELFQLKPDWVYIGTLPNQHGRLVNLLQNMGVMCCPKNRLLTM
jgi:predicted dehydrogenase